MIIDIDTHRHIIRINNEFDESKHPRKPSNPGKGEFVKKGSGGAGISKIGPNTSIRITGMSDKEFKELCGPTYTGVSGQAAIDKLMFEKKGWVPNAFYRKDIGNIALMYGDHRMGLVHLIEHRQKEKQPVRKMLLAIPEIIQKGKKTINERGRIELEYKDKVVIIDPKKVNKNVMFVFTGYYKKESRPRLVY